MTKRSKILWDKVMSNEKYYNWATLVDDYDGWNNKFNSRYRNFILSLSSKGKRYKLKGNKKCF